MIVKEKKRTDAFSYLFFSQMEYFHLISYALCLAVWIFCLPVCVSSSCLLTWCSFFWINRSFVSIIVRY